MIESPEHNDFTKGVSSSSNKLNCPIWADIPSKKPLASLERLDGTPSLEPPPSRGYAVSGASSRMSSAQDANSVSYGNFKTIAGKQPYASAQKPQAQPLAVLPQTCLPLLNQLLQLRRQCPSRHLLGGAKVHGRHAPRGCSLHFSWDGGGANQRACPVSYGSRAAKHTASAGPAATDAAHIEGLQAAARLCAAQQCKLLYGG